MAEKAGNRGGFRELLEQLPMDRLREETENLARAGAQRAATAAATKVEEATDRLTKYTENGGPKHEAVVSAGKALSEGKSPARALLSAGVTGTKEAISQVTGGGSGNGAGKVKVTNIVETIDVGVPIGVAYNQWTQFQDFPTFTKKVESVDAESDSDDEQELTWKAQVFWSHRSWDATVVEQVPDKHIVWKSSGQKGSVDGAVSFHEITPNLTRILLVLEYYPQGFVERVGNLWRAPGRRARLEFKHFRRHVMTRTLLAADEVEGWRGVIHDGEVVKTHEQALEDEKEDEASSEGEPRDEDEHDEDEPDEDEDEDRDETDEDEDDDRTESDEDEEDEDEDDEDEGREDKER